LKADTIVALHAYNSTSYLI